MVTDTDPLDWPYAAFPAGYTGAIQGIIKEAKEYRMAADAEADAGDAARQEASRLRAALVEAEATLRRVQTFIGLLRQYDPEVSMLVAKARQTANEALGICGMCKGRGLVPGAGRTSIGGLAAPFYDCPQCTTTETPNA